MIRTVLLAMVMASPYLAFAQIPPELFQEKELILSLDLVPAKSATLSWNNGLQADSGYFIVERKTDTGEFRMLLSVKASPQLPVYRVTDEKPFEGTNHYRVKFVDAAGKATYSRVASGDLGSGSFSRFYPNPADNHLIVRSSTQVEATIFNSTGNLILTRLLDKGMVPLDISTLAKGIYVLVITNTQTKSVLRQILYKN